MQGEILPIAVKQPSREGEMTQMSFNHRSGFSWFFIIKFTFINCQPLSLPKSEISPKPLFHLPVAHNLRTTTRCFFTLPTWGFATTNSIFFAVLSRYVATCKPSQIESEVFKGDSYPLCRCHYVRCCSYSNLTSCTKVYPSIWTGYLDKSVWFHTTNNGDLLLVSVRRVAAAIMTRPHFRSRKDYNYVATHVTNRQCCQSRYCTRPSYNYYALFRPSMCGGKRGH